MKKTNLISVQQFCTHYKVPVTFINELHNYELIEIIVTNSEKYLKIRQLNEVEKMMRLHYELDINLEGLDVISNLLNQLKALQEENRTLKNKIRFYKDL